MFLFLSVINRREQFCLLSQNFTYSCPDKVGGEYTISVHFCQQWFQRVRLVHPARAHKGMLPLKKIHRCCWWEESQLDHHGLRFPTESSSFRGKTQLYDDMASRTLCALLPHHRHQTLVMLDCMFNF